MSGSLRRGALGALLFALALGACGPYAQLAQKLDVTAQIDGDTWIAAIGPDRSEIRMLVVGRPDANGSAAFSFTSIAGAIIGTLQGSWTEVGTAGATTLQVAHTYRLDTNAGVNSTGATRDDDPYTLQITVARSADRLVVSGDAGLAGTYVGMTGALARLPATPPQDAVTCAFQIANLTVQSSEVRIIGFGSIGMLQYTSTASFVGTIAGSVSVSVAPPPGPVVTTIHYWGFSDQGGVRIDGPQVTTTSLAGNGSMSGVMRFELAPTAPDPSSVTTITGSIDYSGVFIGGGATSGGSYVVSIDPVGASTAVTSGQVAAVGTLSPSVADCLALP